MSRRQPATRQAHRTTRRRWGMGRWARGAWAPLFLVTVLTLVAVPVSVGTRHAEAAGGAGAWAPTGHMTFGRVYHTATLLPNGQVLVAGGFSVTYPYVLTSAELYNPGTGSWSVTGSMATARVYHTATLLSTGQVLVAGGNSVTNYRARAELYDPGRGRWIPAGRMTTPHYRHAATLLSSGQVLVAGGLNSGGGTLASAELYTLFQPYPTLVLSPASGVYDQPITLSGTNFAPFETVLIYGNATSNAPLYTTSTDAAGSFALHSTVRQGYYGAHAIIAVGQSSGRTAIASFFDNPHLALTPTSGAPGTTTQVDGRGFGASEPVIVHWNAATGLVVGTAMSDTHGHVDVLFTVPQSPVGGHLVYAEGQDSAAQAHALFVVR